MVEYIEREDLLELYRMDDPVLNENGHVPLPVIRQNIMDIPAADVAPVVRCRDCRSYNKPKTGWCEAHLDCEHPDDYCSYGKRKDGAEC